VIDLVFPDKSYSELRNALLQSELETSAIVLTKIVPRKEGDKLLVRQIHQPYDQAYRQRTEYSAQLSPEYLAPLVKQAKLADLAILFVHTHPGSESIPKFSHIDDKGEIVLHKFLEGREITGPNAALVISPKGCQARKLGTKEPVRVLQVGSDYNIFYNPLKSIIENEAFERQVRAFGVDGQEKIKQLKVGIVGLGGTGSVIAQQLAHLGIEKYLLVDPDIVEESNLNRLAGATLKDVRRPKTKVAERYIKSVNPTASVITNEGTILDASTAKLLTETDFIFCCTDSHGSRVVLNQLSYQYYIPCIDMGVSITSKDGRVTHITGRVQMLSPGLSCLTCGNLLDSEAVRRDLMSMEHRQVDPYIIGEPQPQPAVMSLNSTVASFAITMFLGAVTGIPAQSRYQIYNGITGTLRAVAGSVDPSCIVCSKNGAMGKGNEWPLPARAK
jgi:molybdopterin-synthase adenylyltransferase